MTFGPNADTKIDGVPSTQMDGSGWESAEGPLRLAALRMAVELLAQLEGPVWEPSEATLRPIALKKRVPETRLNVSPFRLLQQRVFALFVCLGSYRDSGSKSKACISLSKLKRTKSLQSVFSTLILHTKMILDRLFFEPNDPFISR
jgi:hypothetical protein